MTKAKLLDNRIKEMFVSINHDFELENSIHTLETVEWAMQEAIDTIEVIKNGEIPESIDETESRLHDAMDDIHSAISYKPSMKKRKMFIRRIIRKIEGYQE